MPHPTLPAPCSRGYGLVELCMALALVATLAATALPSFQRTLARVRADSLRMQLHAAVAQARTEAITRRHVVVVCPSADGLQCSSDWSAGWILRKEGTRGQVLAHHALRPSPGIRAEASGGRLRVRFRPDGRSGGSNFSIPICIGGQRHSRVVVNVPGRVRSCRVRGPLPCLSEKEGC